MNRKRLSRLATALVSASMLLAMVAAAPVAARNPTWDIQATKLPPSVTAGHDAGYLISIGNKGPSNINTFTAKITAVSAPTAAATYLSDLSWNFGAHGSCVNAGPVTCDFGTVTAGQYVTFTVAFNVPTGTTGTFDITIAIQSGSGNTGSDGGNSRGDARTDTVKTGINTNPNFDAGFVVDDLLYQTTGSLGRGNKQNSTVEVTDTHLTVTVEDGNGVTTPTCTLAQCTNHGIGEWAYLDVPGNSNLIKVTLNIWGGAVPGGTSPDQIVVVHVDDNNVVTIIGENGVRCTPTTGTPENPECITVTKIGSNFRIVAWLNENGNLRGGY